jgi:hypothetical protein
MALSGPHCGGGGGGAEGRRAGTPPPPPPTCVAAGTGARPARRSPSSAQSRKRGPDGRQVSGGREGDGHGGGPGPGGPGGPAGSRTGPSAGGGRDWGLRGPQSGSRQDPRWPAAERREAGTERGRKGWRAGGSGGSGGFLSRVRGRPRPLSQAATAAPAARGDGGLGAAVFLTLHAADGRVARRRGPYRPRGAAAAATPGAAAAARARSRHCWE